MPGRERPQRTASLLLRKLVPIDPRCRRSIVPLLTRRADSASVFSGVVLEEINERLDAPRGRHLVLVLGVALGEYRERRRRCGAHLCRVRRLEQPNELTDAFILLHGVLVLHRALAEGGEPARGLFEAEIILLVEQRHERPQAACIGDRLLGRGLAG